MYRIPLEWARKPMGIIRDFRLRRRGRWILLSAAIGVVSGLGAIVFDVLFRISQKYLIVGIGTFLPPAPGSEGGPGHLPVDPWMLPLALTVGGLISGALVFWFAPEAEGHGTDAVIKSFHHLKGKIRRRVPFIKTVASAVTIGSGGSAGREGPIAQIGAGFGSFLADLLKLPNHDRRIMMMAGTAGGIGSIFRAPLGSAFFAAEVLYSKPEFEYEVLLPAVISSITGYSIYSSYAGWGFLFDVPGLHFHEPRKLLAYAALGVVCAVFGVIYPKIFYGLRDYGFHKIPIPLWLKPGLGGLVLGLIGVAFPESLGMGYGYMQQIILEPAGHTIKFLVGFAMLKIVATSLTISSGGSGGVFGPSIVIGGALGAAFGQAVGQFLPPGAAPDPAACIMVGMGGFFAGVAKVPFASVIMVMELTGSYGLLVPSLLVATIAYLFVPLSIRLYENQLPARPDSPAHIGSFAVDILRHTTVREYWTPNGDTCTTLTEDTPLDRLVEMASDSQHNVFPVVDGHGRLVGELTLDAIRRAVVTDDPDKLPTITAKDLAAPPVGPVVPDDDLGSVATLLAGRQSDGVVVTETREGDRVLGVYSRRDLLFAYRKEMERTRAAAETPAAEEPF